MQVGKGKSCNLVHCDQRKRALLNPMWALMYRLQAFRIWLSPCKGVAPTICVCQFRRGIYGLGVADGVYMWKTKGIDSGVFSRTLMSKARSEVERGIVDVLKGASRSGLQSNAILAFCSS